MICNLGLRAFFFSLVYIVVSFPPNKVEVTCNYNPPDSLSVLNIYVNRLGHMYFISTNPYQRWLLPLSMGLSYFYSFNTKRYTGSSPLSIAVTVTITSSPTARLSCIFPVSTNITCSPF